MVNLSIQIYNRRIRKIVRPNIHASLPTPNHRDTRAPRLPTPRPHTRQLGPPTFRKRDTAVLDRTIEPNTPALEATGGGSDNSILHFIPRALVCGHPNLHLRNPKRIAQPRRHENLQIVSRNGPTDRRRRRIRRIGTGHVEIIRVQTISLAARPRAPRRDDGAVARGNDDRARTREQAASGAVVDDGEREAAECAGAR